MNVYMLVFIVTTIIVIELLPLIRKKQKKEAAVLIFLGVVTMAYGYYYINNMYTASLINMIFELLNIQ